MAKKKQSALQKIWALLGNSGTPRRIKVMATIIALIGGGLVWVAQTANSVPKHATAASDKPSASGATANNGGIAVNGSVTNSAIIGGGGTVTPGKP